MPHFHFNPTVVSMVPMSFFWQGAVLDSGRLLFVLPTSIVEQISLISISVVGLNILCWTLSRDGNFSKKSAWELVRGS